MRNRCIRAIARASGFDDTLSDRKKAMARLDDVAVLAIDPVALQKCVEALDPYEVRALGNSLGLLAALVPGATEGAKGRRLSQNVLEDGSVQNARSILLKMRLQHQVSLGPALSRDLLAQVPVDGSASAASLAQGTDVDVDNQGKCAKSCANASTSTSDLELETSLGVAGRDSVFFI